MHLWTALVLHSEYLPLPDGLGGIRCERWEHNGICPTCLDSILSNGDQQAILESMMTCGDPLLAVEAKKRLTALSLSTASLVEELVMSSFRLSATKLRMNITGH